MTRFTATLSIGLAASSIAQTSATHLDKLIDRFVKQELTYDPTITYFTGLPTADHSRLPDRTPQALAEFDAEEAADLRELRAIDLKSLPAPSRAPYAILKE